MKTKLTTTLTALVLSIASLTACTDSTSNEGTTTGNPYVQMTITGSSQAATVAMNWIDRTIELFMPILYSRAVALPPPALVDSNGTTVNLNTAWIVVKEIEFEITETADGSEVDGDEIEFEGPYFVDLLDANPSSIGSGQVPNRAYRRVKMKLEHSEAPPVGAPAGLNGNSIYLAGQISGHNFTFAADENSEYEIGGPNALNLANGDDLIVAIQIANLFKQIDLSSITGDVDISSSNRVATMGSACPDIDSSANDLYDCFRKGLESEADFGIDEDGDDDLSDSEDSVN